MKHGSEWYKREPAAYLGGVQGMTAKEHAVYSVTLDLIYQHGGSVNNDPSWIAGWIKDMGASAVRKSIQVLVDRKKLIIEGDQITQNRAKTEAKTKENLRETARENGKKGGEKSAENRVALNKNNALDEPVATGETPAEKTREDKIKGEAKASLSPTASKPKSPTGSRLTKDWVLSKHLGDWALDEGGAWEELIRSEADKFRDYWIGVAGAKGRKADWDATWRNWIRKAVSENSQPRHQLKTINGGRNDQARNNHTEYHSDPALEHIAHLAGVIPTSGNGRF